MHHISEGFGVNAHKQHRNGQQPQCEELLATDILQVFHLWILDGTICHALEHPQRIRSTCNECGGGQQTNPKVKLHSTHDDGKFANEPTGARQTTVRHGKQHKEGYKARHHINNATVIRELAAVQAVIQHPNTHKHGRHDKAVGNHLHDCPFHTCGIKDKEAQIDKAHMSYRGVRHQLFHILLN